MQALVEAGQNFPYVKTIDLGTNQITDKGLQALIEKGGAFGSL